LGDLALLHRRHGKNIKTMKVNYIPTLILSDLEHITRAYIERGFQIEKLTIAK
jgi:hypothetical protein